MRQILHLIINKLKFILCCKLGLFKIPKQERYFHQDEFIEKIKGTAMEAVVDCVGKTNSRVNFNSLFDYKYNKNICVSSDYGGENNASKYNTYTFTFHTYSGLENWLSEVEKLKSSKFYSQIAPEYKTTSVDSRQGKLRDWFELTKKHFKGVIFTFAVDKNIDSLFANTKTDLYNLVKLQPHFKDCAYGEYITEKIFRVSNFMCLVLAHTLQEDGGFFWMSDKDSINQKPDYWKFSIKIHNHILKHYCEHLTCSQKGYAMPFSKKDIFSNDFLSLSDLIAGAYDDYLNHWDNADNPQLMLTSLKGKTIEILSSISDIPSFAYVIDKQSNGGISCKNIEIIIKE